MGRLGGKGTFLSELIWFHAEATEKLMQHYRRSLHSRWHGATSASVTGVHSSRHTI